MHVKMDPKKLDFLATKFSIVLTFNYPPLYLKKKKKMGDIVIALVLSVS